MMSHLWCGYCERVYPSQDWKERGWKCPTPECDCMVMERGKAWKRVKLVHPVYPDDPETGVRYPWDPKGW